MRSHVHVSGRGTCIISLVKVLTQIFPPHPGQFGYLKPDSERYCQNACLSAPNRQPDCTLPRSVVVNIVVVVPRKLR